MPNLTSVERLARFYEDDANYFVLLLVKYSLDATHAHVSEVTFVSIEYLDWDCLTMGALGWGQIQIANSNYVHVRPRYPRKQGMLELCDVMLAQVTRLRDSFRNLRDRNIVSEAFVGCLCLKADVVKTRPLASREEPAILGRVRRQDRQGWTMFLRRCIRKKSGKPHGCGALIGSSRTARGSRRRRVAYVGKLKKSERNGRAQLGRRLERKARPQPSLFDPPPYEDPGVDAQTLWKHYIPLTEAEWAFRITKDELVIRPIWHQKPERVKAHVPGVLPGVCALENSGAVDAPGRAG